MTKLIVGHHSNIATTHANKQENLLHIPLSFTKNKVAKIDDVSSSSSSPSPFSSPSRRFSSSISDAAGGFAHQRLQPCCTAQLPEDDIKTLK
jgi:hypothetical protein